MTRLLRLYPKRWQQRYGDEFAALVESQPRSATLVFDVLRGALDAWLRPQLAPRPSAAPAGGGLSGRLDRFDKFTPRSRLAFRQAQTEAESQQQAFIGTDVDPPTRGLTSRSKRAIELSVNEAQRMRHSWVGTEHLLLGLLNEGSGTAAGALRVVGLTDLDEVRRRVKLQVDERK